MDRIRRPLPILSLSDSEADEDCVRVVPESPTDRIHGKETEIYDASERPPVVDFSTSALSPYGCHNVGAGDRLTAMNVAKPTETPYFPESISALQPHPRLHSLFSRLCGPSSSSNAPHVTYPKDHGGALLNAGVTTSDDSHRSIASRGNIVLEQDQALLASETARIMRRQPVDDPEDGSYTDKHLHSVSQAGAQISTRGRHMEDYKTMYRSSLNRERVQKS